MGRTLPLAGESTDVQYRTDGAPTTSTLLEACTSSQRRTVLETLAEAGPMTLGELAERVAARRHEVSTDDVAPDEREEVAIGLHHNHLQRLSADDVVEQTGDGMDTTVSLSPGVDPELVRELIGIGEGNWTELSVILGDERRQHVTAALSQADGPLSLEELTAAVASREHEEADGPQPDRGSVRISLHHVHLPKLSEAGVVRYDENGLAQLERLPEAYDADAADDTDAVTA